MHCRATTVVAGASRHHWGTPTSRTAHRYDQEVFEWFPILGDYYAERHKLLRRQMINIPVWHWTNLKGQVA